MDTRQDITTIDWITPQGLHDGGLAYGQGFLISWQRGSIQQNGRNGAFLIEVLTACQMRLEHYQSGQFACEENATALRHLAQAIAALESRRDRRIAANTYGTTQADCTANTDGEDWTVKLVKD